MHNLQITFQENSAASLENEQVPVLIDLEEQSVYKSSEQKFVLKRFLTGE